MSVGGSTVPRRRVRGTLIEAEARRARELYAEGFIRQIWRRSDQPGACILWEAGSAEQVGDQLQTLPFIRAGMLELSIHPLLPYAGFQYRGASAARRVRAESEDESARSRGHAESGRLPGLSGRRTDAGRRPLTWTIS